MKEILRNRVTQTLSLVGIVNQELASSRRAVKTEVEVAFTNRNPLHLAGSRLFRTSAGN